MSVLALDLGQSTGWARSDGTNGVFSVRGIPDHGAALAIFSDWIEGMVDEAPLAYLAVERGFGGNNASGRLTTAMELTAHSVAWSRNVPRTDMAANSVRKLLLGFASIAKATEPSKTARTRLLDKAIMVAVQARGFRPTSEHAADACALLICCEHTPCRAVAA